MELFSPTILYGKGAFFNDSSYSNELKKEYNSLPPSCIYHSTQKTEKNNTPLFGYLFKRISKWSIIPSVDRVKELGTILSQNTQTWKYKRVTLPIGELSIDSTIMGRPSTLYNKKWVLVSVGRLERYGDIMTNKAFLSFLKTISANAILFNYPKVGVSTGPRNAKNMVTAYKAILEFLEDKKNGIGAKKIIGYGYSMGGGVQGKALNTHPLEEGQKKGIQYLFIKDRTFSSLDCVVSSLTKGFVGKRILKFGWDLSSLESSKRLALLQIPEIIVQTTDLDNNPNSDGVISKLASLKHAILNASLENKWFVDIPNHEEKPLHGCHDARFSKELSTKVNSLMKTTRVKT